jgi:hydroxymethylpyrimidine pyrophosphatase-like HAD family hydrolase
VESLRKALPGARVALETPSGLWREPDYELSPIDPDDSDPGRRIGSMPELLAGLAGEPVLKIIAADRYRPSAAMSADATPALGDTANVSFSKGMGLLEVGPPGVTKATALAAWCAARGITADQVVAFGDMPNDLPMLRWAGHSYAVANAHPEVIDAADAVTGSNEEDGVAMVVERLFR